MRTHVQNCGRCEAFDCGDNVNTIGKEESACAETMGAPREHKEAHKIQAIENTSNMTCIRCWSKTACTCEPIKVEPTKKKRCARWRGGVCFSTVRYSDIPISKPLQCFEDNGCEHFIS